MNWRKRFAQWEAALIRAQRTAGPLPWWTMIRAILGGVVPRSVWRARMRYGCAQCPVYDGVRKVCRGVVAPYDTMGCFCYTPLEALTAEPYPGGCWGAAQFGPFGWEAYPMGRLERWYSPIRFLLGR